MCRAQSVYCGNEERSVVSLLFTATSPAACAYVGSACTPGSWCLEKTHTLRFNHTWTVQVLESHMRTIFPKPTLSSRILYLVFPFSLFPSLPVLLPVSHPFTFHLTSLSVYLYLFSLPFSTSSSPSLSPSVIPFHFPSHSSLSITLFSRLYLLSLFVSFSLTHTSLPLPSLPLCRSQRWLQWCQS